MRKKEEEGGVILRYIKSTPREHWEGHWMRGRKYPLYSVVENNGSIFVSMTGKEKEEPYVIYDKNNGFYANEGWELREASADSKITAKGAIPAVVPDVPDTPDEEMPEDYNYYEMPDGGIPPKDMSSLPLVIPDNPYSTYTLSAFRSAFGCNLNKLSEAFEGKYAYARVDAFVGGARMTHFFPLFYRNYGDASGDGSIFILTDSYILEISLVTVYEVTPGYGETGISREIHVAKKTFAQSLAQLSADSTHRLVSDAEKEIWNGKASGSSGPSTRRPQLTSSDAGYMYFDNGLEIPIWWTGEDWTDASGNLVPMESLPDDPDEPIEEET